MKVPWRFLIPCSTAVVTSLAVYLGFRSDFTKTDWQTLAEMGSRTTDGNKVEIEGYLVSFWIHEEGGRDDVECWTSVYEQHPVLAKDSRSVGVKLGFSVIPEEYNFQRVRIKGIFSNDSSLIKSKENLGLISKVSSIEPIDTPQSDQDRVVEKLISENKGK